MVKIALQIKATLENIDELKTSGVDFRWYLKFSCNNCGEVSEKWNYASLDESTPAQRGNGVNHFVSKCKLCSRENSMTIIEDSLKSYSSDDQGKFKTIVCLDCRGIEPCDFSAREGWIAKACDNGNVFADIDLAEGEWVEYCDKINSSVGIYEIESRFERIK
ncbi:CXXC motif containing zinc binding protein [Leptopilina heterotoma]|uniref:CXXC motif containing zinc binding protein n=1 Tax=Leptopilina heterotoma TaxID=63436 RepID=UPI001CA8DE7C|nr:CXXC motif containing zinc binding protein [Leptopilina heterotoma]